MPMGKTIALQARVVALSLAIGNRWYLRVTG